MLEEMFPSPPSDAIGTYMPTSVEASGSSSGFSVRPLVDSRFDPGSFAGVIVGSGAGAGAGVGAGADVGAGAGVGLAAGGAGVGAGGAAGSSSGGGAQLVAGFATSLLAVPQQRGIADKSNKARTPFKISRFGSATDLRPQPRLIGSPSSYRLSPGCAVARPSRQSGVPAEP